LAKRGFDPVLGARPLRRTIQREIEDQLSEKILFGEIGPGPGHNPPRGLKTPPPPAGRGRGGRGVLTSRQGLLPTTRVAREGYSGSPYIRARRRAGSPRTAKLRTRSRRRRRSRAGCPTRPSASCRPALRPRGSGWRWRRAGTGSHCGRSCRRRPAAAR
ncbi:hypothetical protein, partial [Nocardia cyriacigeorgica]|uniref:hypothetical protein n=1 Tax=Nocardia cyriacigeorgica TaxID=135487 RepID=UPI003CC80CC3